MPLAVHSTASSAVVVLCLSRASSSSAVCVFRVVVQGQACQSEGEGGRQPLPALQLRYYLLQHTVYSTMVAAAPPSPSLSHRLPFSEAAVWEGSRDYVRLALGVQHVEVLRVEQEGVVAAADPSARAKDVVPGDPSVHAYAEAGAK